MTDRLSELALWIAEYHRVGLRVFPCLPYDKPLALKWKCYVAEPQSLAVIGDFATDSNLGIATGFNGVFVVDFDSLNALTHYLTKYPHLANTMRVLTNRGMHLYYRINNPPSNGKMFYCGQHIGEVRGAGGYVVAPPSIHPNGAEYKHITMGFGIMALNSLDELYLEFEKPIVAPGSAAQSVLFTSNSNLKNAILL